MSFAHERARKLRAQENQQRMAEWRRDHWSGFEYDMRLTEEAAARDAEKYGGGPINTLNKAYAERPLLTGAAPAIAKAERKHRELAESFSYDARKEALLKLNDAHDPVYDTFDPTEKMALSMYERAKAAAKELGLPTGDPNGE